MPTNSGVVGCGSATSGTATRCSSASPVPHIICGVVDQAGHVLDILVQSRRNKQAARSFFRRLLKHLAYVPRVLISDKLASYGAARHDVLPSVAHRRHKGLNNRAENPHQPTRERERWMRQFKGPGHAQRFLAAYGPIASHCRPRRHRLLRNRRPALRHLAGHQGIAVSPAVAPGSGGRRDEGGDHGVLQRSPASTPDRADHDIRC
jgi:hypothetical protein